VGNCLVTSFSNNNIDDKLESHKPLLSRSIQVPYDASVFLVVDERETGDQVVQAIKPGGDQVLGVVADEFQECQHGQSSVLKLLRLALLVFIRGQLQLADIKVAKVPVVIDGTNQEDDLGPSQERDGINGGNSRWDGRERDAGSNVSGEVVGLGRNVAQDGQHAYTPMLQFCRAVLGKGFGGDAVAELGGVKVSRGGDDAGFVLEGSGSIQSGTSACLVGHGGKGSSRSHEGDKDGGGLHDDDEVFF
jgi:hypothetical protein